MTDMYILWCHVVSMESTHMCMAEHYSGKKNDKDAHQCHSPDADGE